MRFILIAAKQLEFAKTRLAPACRPVSDVPLPRRCFATCWPPRSVRRAADHVAVVTSDAGLLAMARAADALAIDEEFPRGLNVAIALATSALIAAGRRNRLHFAVGHPAGHSRRRRCGVRRDAVRARRRAGALARFLRHQHHMPKAGRRHAHSVRPPEPGQASGRMPDGRRAVRECCDLRGPRSISMCSRICSSSSAPADHPHQNQLARLGIAHH